MAARTKTKVSPKYKTKYRVKNWPAYDIALKDRGDITIWFDKESICAWNAPPSGRPGGQRKYSDLAIVTALTLRTVFHLPLRQTEGFVASLIGLMGLALQTPDHTTLSRRHRSVEVPHLPKGHEGPLHLVIDSTGLKIFGDGEWRWCTALGLTSQFGPSILFPLWINTRGGFADGSPDEDQGVPEVQDEVPREELAGV